MSVLSERLKELRGPTSQSEMARQLGMPRPQWIRYETGKSVPGADILAKICRVHACSADWLLGIERGTSAAVVVGNNNAVGAGARVSIRGESAAEHGKMPACSKCPVKKRLEKIEKMARGTA